jgi:hypothetical protein
MNREELYRAAVAANVKEIEAWVSMADALTRLGETFTDLNECLKWMHEQADLGVCLLSNDIDQHGMCTIIAKNPYRFGWMKEKNTDRYIRRS